MPTIAVNLGAVKDDFESLPFGKYLGEIEKAVLKEATERGKFDQIQVSFVVIEGDLTGRKQSTWLSFSPKAAFMMKRFFNKFGLGDIPELSFDDDTNELTEPDIAGYQVIFEVKPDRKDPDRIRTELVSVEDGQAPAPAASVRVAPKPVKAAKPEPVEEAEEVEDVEVPDAKAAAKAARIAAAQAALEAAAADDDDETEEVEAEAPAPRKAPVRPAPAARTAPARRTLR